MRPERADRLHDADLRYLLSEEDIEHVGDHDGAEHQGDAGTGQNREEQGVGLPLVGVLIGLGNLDLADRQTVFPLQPFADVGGYGHDGIAVTARRCLSLRVGDLDLQLVQDGLSPGRRQRRRG